MTRLSALQQFDQLNAQIQDLLKEMRLLLVCPRSSPSLCSQARD